MNHERKHKIKESDIKQLQRAVKCKTTDAAFSSQRSRGPKRLRKRRLTYLRLRRCFKIVITGANISISSRIWLLEEFVFLSSAQCFSSRLQSGNFGKLCLIVVQEILLRLWLSYSHHRFLCIFVSTSATSSGFQDIFDKRQVIEKIQQCFGPFWVVLLGMFTKVFALCSEIFGSLRAILRKLNSNHSSL